MYVQFLLQDTFIFISDHNDFSLQLYVGTTIHNTYYTKKSS